MPPSPLWGGYRQVAAEVLQSVSRAGVDWLDESLKPFLGALESASAGVDPWILDTWLLRTERALDLDGSSGGHPVAPAARAGPGGGGPPRRPRAPLAPPPAAPPAP